NFELRASNLIGRFPASITDPNFQLPASSNRAADFAPLLGLDLVPRTHCTPILPISAPDLDSRFNAQIDHFTDTYVNLRADMLDSPSPPPSLSAPCIRPSLSHPPPSSHPSAPCTPLGQSPTSEISNNLL